MILLDFIHNLINLKLSVGKKVIHQQEYPCYSQILSSVLEINKNIPKNTILGH